ncbi:ABC-three component system protein [Priestia aryabhattai]|uniref:ABC-three component system protein n=1 Tax=Priestia aryabhattai TaxID=412384 RepID=UPI001CBAF417|nr:ABC-three component system protein [Priestia aryabhattai]
MGIYSKYKELAVEVNCGEFRGSGCMFQPFTNDYSYVITARHCLEGTDETPQTFKKTDIEIVSHSRGSKIIVIDYYFHKKYDLVVIKTEYVEGIPGTLITVPKENKDVGLYGYPNILSADDTAQLGQYLECKTYFNYPQKNLIEFRAIPDVSNLINSVNSTLRGFSGSGIYLESNDNLFLMGVFTQLKEEDGAFDALLGYDISAINEILLENQLQLLIPGELLNFEKYIDTAFESNEGYIKSVLKMNTKPLLDLVPNDIVKSFNEKLYIPYNSFIEEELLNHRLWEGWVSLLTYYYMDTSTLPNKEDFKLVRSNVAYNHNIKMYFTGNKRISACIMDLFVNNYDDLEINDVIVINTKNSNPGTKSFNKDKTKRILHRIDYADKEKLFEKGIDIDEPETLKDVEFIHIDLFQDIFSEHDEIDKRSILEEKLKESIKEVFNNVP